MSEHSNEQLAAAIPKAEHDKDKVLLSCALIEQQGLEVTSGLVSVISGINQEAVEELLRRLQIDGQVEP